MRSVDVDDARILKKRLSMAEFIRKLFTVCVIVVGLCVFEVIAQSTTVVGPSTWHATPVDNERMNNRIASAAEQYKEYAPIPRIALYDIGYPMDAAEFTELNGHAILLISSMSQDPSELPL